MNGIYTGQLNSNEYIGYTAMEIDSFPELTENPLMWKEDISEIGTVFMNLAGDAFRMSPKDKTAFELTWVAENVENQVVSCRVHLFLTIRMIMKDRQILENNLYQMRNHWQDILNGRGFRCDICMGLPENNALTKYIRAVNKERLLCIYKNEKCAGGYNSPYPYYYSEIVPAKNRNNFVELIQLLSRQKPCMLTFQILPTIFTTEEQICLNKLSTETAQIASGYPSGNGMTIKDPEATEPASVLKYYNDRKNAPLFYYNILATGDRDNCRSVISQTISLLQSGTETICRPEFACGDMSQEPIEIDSQIWFYPFNVNRILLYKEKYRTYVERNRIKAIPMAQMLGRLPLVMTQDEISSFFRLPLYEKTMVGLNNRLLDKETGVFNDEVLRKDNIQIGEYIQPGKDNIMLGCPERVLTQHMLIVGSPGSGKTTFCLNLLHQLAERGIPFLAVEPTKTEYRTLTDIVPNLRVFTPGKNEVAPFIINPFLPPKGITVEQYTPALMSAFDAAFSMPKPLDMLFLKAINRSYAEHGWKLYSKVGDEGTIPFGLRDFILVFKKLIKQSGYSGEVKGNIESGGLLRLSNLLEQNRNIYDTVRTIPVENLLSEPTVIELNAIENQEQKALLIALLLTNICVYVKNGSPSGGKLQNAILIDEAHVLLGNRMLSGNNGDEQPLGTAIKRIEDMIAEVRAYGTGIIIADQLPSRVGRNIIANTDIKLMFRIVETSERNLIAGSSNMPEKGITNLGKLQSGESYFFYHAMNEPVLVQTEDIRRKYGMRIDISNDEIRSRNSYWETFKDQMKPYVQCSLCYECKNGCMFRIRDDAEYYASIVFEKFSERLKSKEQLLSCCANMEYIMENYLISYEEKQRGRLLTCTRIHLMNLFEQERDGVFSNKEKILGVLKNNVVKRKE